MKSCSTLKPAHRTRGTRPGPAWALRYGIILAMLPLLLFAAAADFSLASAAHGSDNNEAQAAEAPAEQDVQKAAEAFAGGSGTPGDPFLVASAEQLELVRKHLDSHFLQTADIDLSTHGNWDPIGSLYMEGMELLDEHFEGFSGTYDGGGHTITGLTIANPESEYAEGLFGLIQEPGKVRRLTLEAMDVHGKDIVGGLVGFLGGGLLEDVHVDGVVKGRSGLGGIAGIAAGVDVMKFDELITGLSPASPIPQPPKPTISHCSSSASVTGVVSVAETIGGIAGMAFLSIIEHSQASGAVEGEELTGGIAGILFGSNIENSTASGNVSGRESIGGLAGTVMLGSTIEHSQASATVTGTEIIGGLAGLHMERSTIVDSKASGVVNGRESAGGLVGGMTDEAVIERSYAEATVSGHEVIGGLAGVVMDGSRVSNSFASGDVQGQVVVAGLAAVVMDASIANCYAVGGVEGEEGLGGLVGYQENSAIEGSYFDADTTGQADSGLGTALGTADMKQQGTYEGWDFDSIWSIDEGQGYPYLRSTFGGSH